jgi:exopolysaccharide production protein ExoY
MSIEQTVFHNRATTRGRYLNKDAGLTLKRAIDISGAILLLILVAPLFLIVALTISIKGGPGPIIYRQERIGRAGRRFLCLKFRTMHSDAEDALRDLLAQDPHAKAEWERTQKLTRDPRVSQIGHVLRTTSLDELPQLWNVLRGDMSLVGPRPVTSGEMRKWYEVLGGAAAYKTVRPGITGLWQVSGRNRTTYESRVALDRHYVENLSLRNDTIILFRTFGAVIRRVGAC